MHILLLVTLPLVYNIIHGIAVNKTDKFLKRVKLEENQDESSYETDPTRTYSKRPEFNHDFIPRKKRCIFQRKMPEYLNTFAIPASNVLSVVTADKATDSSPSSTQKNNDERKQNHCVQCKVSFRYDKHYVKHCKNVHGIRKPFYCSYCEGKFGYRRSLIEHVNVVHGMKNNPYTRWKKQEPIVCEVCHETLPGWTIFEEHALSKHEGIKMMSCSNCQEKFLRRRQLLSHEKLKHRTLEVKCEICKNIFERSDILMKHLEFCEQRQTRNKMGSNQLVTIMRYDMLVCEECGDDHKTLILLKDHIRSKHPHVKLHPCNHCEASFTNIKSLEKHASMLHPDKTGEIKTWRKFKRGAIFTCEYCEEIIAGASKYEKHGKEHPGLPMFRCKDCGKGYGARKSLTHHANEVHGNVKKRCTYCSKCYFKIATHEKYCKKKIEKRERKRMAGYPKHFCGICSQDFYMTYHSFRCHVNSHKYLDCCGICGQRFRRGEGALNEHMERKHPLRENIEALLRTADEVRTFVKREKAAHTQYTNTRKEDFDLLRDFPEVKAESPEFCVKLEGNNSRGRE